MDQKSDSYYDVIIIGAGPAGLSLAHLLADTKMHIAVIEQLDDSILIDPPVDGRDIALTHFSVELLKEMGIWCLFPSGAISALKEARVLNGQSPYYLDFDHRDTEKDALGYLVPNHCIRKACYEAVISSHNIDIISSSEVTSVETNGSKGSVQLATGQSLNTSLVIAADSRFSTIRRQMGISTAMKDFGRVVIVCQMEHAKPHDNIAYECFHYDQTLAVLPLDGNKSSVVVTLPADKSSDVLNMDEPLFNANIEKRFDHRLGAMKLVGKRYPYPLVATYANQFISTRFALIGDAAVGMHPVTAHGFNLGLKGAHTLASSIKHALAHNIDIGDASILESYQSQHRRIAKPLYLGTNALVDFYTTQGVGAKLARGMVLRLANHLPPVKRMIINQLTDSSLSSPMDKLAFKLTER